MTTDFRGSVSKANSGFDSSVPQGICWLSQEARRDIHEDGLSGYAMLSVLRRYELFHARNQQIAPFSYQIENLKRILSTYRAILDGQAGAWCSRRDRPTSHS